MKEQNSNNILKILKYWWNIILGLFTIVPIIWNSIKPNEQIPLYIIYLTAFLFILSIFVHLWINEKKRNKLLEKEIYKVENTYKKKLTEENTNLKNELDKEKKKNIKPGTDELLFRRFRTILSKKRLKEVIDDKEYVKNLDDKLKTRKSILYGSIDYRPFFWYEKKGGDDEKPNGIGFNILSKVFEISSLNIKPYESVAHLGFNWNSIFDSLIKKDFDVIITPMYETRTRIYKNVSFCLPLFYSDIGIYMKEDKYKDKNSNKLSLKYYDEAIDYLNEYTNKKAATLPGELSEVIARKQKFTIDKKEANNSNTVYKEKNFELLLEQVMKGDKDFVFMEVFKAEQIINKYKPKKDTAFKELKLINILKMNQLVYPVSFVVRKEDTVLRNFINLRIAELREDRKLLKIIEDEAKKIGIGINEVRERFIQTYDFSLIDEEYSQNNVLFSKRIKDEYNILDKVYSNYYISFQENNIKEHINKFIDENGNDVNILEIGCGTGITTKIMLDINKNIVVTAIDSDSQMIEIVKKNFHNEIEKNRLKISTSDALHYLRSKNEFSKEDCKYDIIISAFTIHNFDKVYRRKLLGEIRKLMTEKSLFINIDKYAPDDDIKRVEALSYRLNRYKEELKGKPKLLEEWTKHYIEDQSENKVMKTKETKDLMEELGFEIEHYEESGELEMMAILIAKKIS